MTWAERYREGFFFHKRPPGDYKVTFRYLSGGNWVSGSAAPSELRIGGTGPQTIAAKGEASAPSDAELTLEDPLFDATAQTGFFRMTLNYGFGHESYIDEKTLALIEIAANGSAGGDDDDDSDDGGGGMGIEVGFVALDGTLPPEIARGKGGLPHQPYLPKVAALSLDYQSQETDVARAWRIHPFGVEPADGPGRILPDLPFEGALYLGIEALDPPESLSLLVQVVDGTGDPLLELPELDHAWLGSDGWRAFKNQEVIDRTGDLAGSGLLSYAVPQEARTNAPEMPTGLHWLRISAQGQAAAVNRLHLVVAQALQATFLDRGNDPAFLETPLPKGTIRKLVIPDPAVKGLTQPFPSFGGRGKEETEDFRRRASERLRHKDRAVTMWDYEHLALEAFPRLYRTKALQHTELVRENGLVVADNELAPGAVTFVAVPYTDGADLRDPLRPWADRATLAGLKSHLSRRTSPFVRLATAHPKYEEIHVSMKVSFRDGIADTDFYRAEIEKALIDHLTPWRGAGASGVEFGGQVHKSTLIDLVEELDYVNFLEDVKMFHRPDPEAPIPPVDLETINATTARSVLVSARSHQIGLV